MAFGDPMVFETLYNWALATNDNFDSLLIGGKFDSSALASDGISPIGWLRVTGVAATPAMIAGWRTGGHGSYFYRSTHASPGPGTILLFYQYVLLRGHSRLVSQGHEGRPFTYNIWARNGGTGTETIQLALTAFQENLTTQVGADGVLGSAITLTATWTKYTITATPTSQLTAAYRPEVICYCTVNGSPILEFDEADFYEYFTFLNRATVPDDPDFIVPGESFARTVNNALLMYGPKDPASAKLRYQLNFGICGLEQLKSLRSFWFLRSPLRWQPNLPHLPTYIQCRIVSKSFGFAIHKSSFGANLYHGVLMLEEI